MPSGEPRTRRPAIRHVLLGTFSTAVALIMLLSLVVLVVISFSARSDLRFPPQSFSLRWYRHLFNDTDLISSAYYSIWLGVVSAAISLAVGALCAYALSRRRVVGREAVRVTLISSIVVPKIVLGVGLFILFARLHVYGSRTALVLAHSAISLPFVVALLTAALVTADPSLEEASRDLGASGMRTFFRIVFPQIRVSLLVSWLIAFIVSFDQLESTLFLLRPGNETLPVALYGYQAIYQDPTSAALSSLSIGLSVVLVLVMALALTRGNALRTLTAANRGEGQR